MDNGEIKLPPLDLSQIKAREPGLRRDHFPASELEKTPEKNNDAAQFKQVAFNNMNMGAYAPPNEQVRPDLSPKEWEKEKEDQAKKPWDATVEGRLMKRAVSRGIGGVVAGVAFGRYANVKMANYHPEEMPKNAIQGIAKAYDVLIGKPIQYVVSAFGGAEAGKRAVTFRPMRQAEGYKGLQGVSFGHDVVDVTAIFAGMSVGDKATSDAINIFDKNQKKSWMKDGHIDLGQAAKSLGTAGWQYLTYNQGEDWAVAPLYVYLVRGQRNLINKLSPGFAIDSDNGMNGASHKVNSAGQVVGNYNMEGAADLWSRFAMYNVLTRAYRAAYIKAADSYLKWQECGFETPKLTDPAEQKSWGEALVQGAKDAANFTLTNFAVGGTYMLPAVPAFFISRGPQNKYRGLFIHPEHGVMQHEIKPGQFVNVQANEIRREGNLSRPEAERFTANSPTYFRKFNEESRKWDAGVIPVANPLANGNFDPYAKTFGQVDSVFNASGKANNWLRKKGHTPVEWLNKNFDIKVPKNMADALVLNSIAYTPYFAAKTETANLFDNKRTEMGIERARDGILHGNPAEFKAGVGEYVASLLQKPLPDPKREAEAQEAIKNDTTPADIFDPEIGKLGHRGNKQCYLERLAERKEKANHKLDQLKARTAMSFSEKVLAEQNLQKEADQRLKEKPSENFRSFVQNEDMRVSRDEFAPLGTKFH